MILLNQITLTAQTYLNQRIEFPSIKSAHTSRSSKIENDTQTSTQPMTSRDEHRIIKGIEYQKRDSNREILNELVFKKLKQRYDTALDGMDRGDLAAQVKMISDETMNNFLALKGFATINDPTNLKNISQKLIQRKQDGGKQNAFSDQIAASRQEQKEKEQSSVDYKVTESIISKKYEDCSNEIKKIRDKVSNLNHDSYLLRQDQKNVMREVEQNFLKVYYIYIILERRNAF